MGIIVELFFRNLFWPLSYNKLKIKKRTPTALTAKTTMNRLKKIKEDAAVETKVDEKPVKQEKKKAQKKWWFQ